MVDVLAEVPRSEAWALKYVTAENQLWHCLQACSLGNKSNCAVADPWASWHIPQLASSWGSWLWVLMNGSLGWQDWQPPLNRNRLRRLTLWQCVQAICEGGWSAYCSVALLGGSSPEWKLISLSPVADSRRRRWVPGDNSAVTVKTPGNGSSASRGLPSSRSFADSPLAMICTSAPGNHAPSGGLTIAPSAAGSDSAEHKSSAASASALEFNATDRPAMLAEVVLVPGRDACIAVVKRSVPPSHAVRVGIAAVEFDSFNDASGPDVELQR